MRDVFLTISPAARILVAVTILWLAGFLMSRVTKVLKLPNVTGYILAGVAIGPYALDLIPADITSGMEFVTDIALAFIAFGVGRYLRLDRLKQQGTKVIVLTLMEALVTAAVVTTFMLVVFHLSLPFSLLLGAIGSATAPASSLMTIRQYRAKGPFVNTLVQVVAMDDAVALLAFSVCAAIASGAETPVVDWQSVLTPLAVNAGVLLASYLLGRLLCVLLNGRSSDHRLVLTCAFVFFIAAGCAALDVSPLLGCMLLGATYVNVRGDKTLFKQVSRVTPPINVMFFVLSGMRLDLSALTTVGIIGAAYFVVRIAGKFLGSWMGARMTGMPVGVRRYLGLALIPQAGVSIGLAVLAQRILPAESGALLSTIILSSSVLYEMIGPVCARKALFLSGAVPGVQGTSLADGEKAIKADKMVEKPVKADKSVKADKNQKADKAAKSDKAVKAEKPVKAQRDGKESEKVSAKKNKKAVPDGRPMPLSQPEPKIRWAGGSQRMWAIRREQGSFHRS